jgi:uncharacterized protein (TIGR02646 family)
MKYIQKSNGPRIYIRWCADVAGTAKEDYRELPVAEKEALLGALIQEQGELCAYTMRRIADGSSHVEHIKPQVVCRAHGVGEDLNYANLVACFPRDGMKARYRYGAQRKDNWWDNGGALFVSPLHPACEQRFDFDIDGTISPVRDNPAAVATIKVLALDHESLTEDRKRVIEEFIYGPAGDAALSAAQAVMAQASICNRFAQGHFAEFCVAIRHALGHYVSILNKRARRNRAIRRRG